MKKLAQVGVLCSLFNCSPEELTKHSKTVYSWMGITYEVVGSKSLTAPHSHYSKYYWGGKTWYFRELGEKSQIIKNLKEAIKK